MANRVFIVQILAYIKIPEGHHFLIPLLINLIKINITYFYKMKAGEKQNRNQLKWK